MSLRICSSPRAEASAISARSRCFSGQRLVEHQPEQPQHPAHRRPDLVAHRREEARLRERRRLGLPPAQVELLLALHVRGHVPEHPDQPPRPVGRLVDRGHVADVANLAVRSDDAVLRDEAAAPVRRLAGLGDRPRAVLRVQRRGPVRLAEEPLPPGIAEERPHPLVPDQLVGRQLDVPDPDARGRDRELEPPREPRQLGLPLADHRDPALARLGGPRRSDDRQHHADRGQREQRAQPPGRGRRRPAAARNRRDLPCPVRQRHRRRHRVLPEDRRIAVERRAFRHPVLRRDRHRNPEVRRVEARRGIEPGGVDHRRDDPPEPPLGPGSVIDEHRRPDDEAAAALDQIDRTHQHRDPEVARQLDLRKLIRQVAVVDPDHRVVVAERVDAPDHQVGGRGDVPDLARRAQHLPGEPHEPAVGHVRLEADDRDEALDELDVAVDRALQPGRQQRRLALHLRAHGLARRRPALALGVGPEQRDRRDGPRRSEPGHPQQRTTCCFDLLHSAGPFGPLEVVWRSRLINCE